MPLLRLLLLLGIIGGLTLFALQNWSPPLALVFLGIRTQPLPLALWLLIAIAAGALTGLVVIGLLSLSTYTARLKLRSQLGKAYRSYNASPPKPRPQPDPVQSRPPVSTSAGRTPAPSASESDWEEDDDVFDWQEPTTPPPSPEPTPPQDQKRAENQKRAETVIQDDEDDWDWDAEDDEDVDEEEDERPPRSPGRDRTTYEVPREPTTRSQSGSVYSYGYRAPGQSGAGRSEPIAKPPVSKSVVDAEYRVIVPPYRNLEDETDNEPNDEDDWGNRRRDRRQDDW